ADVVDLDDVRRAEAADRLRLALEALQQVVVGAELLADDLERDGPVERDLRRLVDRAHRAAAEDLGDAAAAEALADQRIGAAGTGAPRSVGRAGGERPGRDARRLGLERRRRRLGDRRIGAPPLGDRPFGAPALRERRLGHRRGRTGRRRVALLDDRPDLALARRTGPAARAGRERARDRLLTVRAPGDDHVRGRSRQRGAAAREAPTLTTPAGALS